MATVNKDFRVKNGLVVEGTTGTIDGNNILTDADTTDILNEGSVNLYFTDDRVTDTLVDTTYVQWVNAVVAKEGGILTITTENGVDDSTTDDLDEGSTNLYFTEQRVLDAVSDALGDDYWTTDDLSEGTANLYFTDTRVYEKTKTALVEGTGITLTSDDEAETITVEVDTESIATREYVDAVSEGLHIHASVAVATEESISLSSPPSSIDGVTLVEAMRVLVKDQSDLEENGIYVFEDGSLVRAEDHDTAAEIQAGDFVFVEGGTLYGATGWVQLNSVSTLETDPIEWTQFLGAGTFVGGTGIEIDGQEVSIDFTEFDTDNVDEGSTNLYFTDQRVLDVIDTITTDEVDEGSTNLYFTDQRAVDAIEAVVPAFTAVEINASLQVASSLGLTDAEVPYTVYSFDKTVYRSAKFLVKAASGSHTQISEVLLTLDTSDNVAITEYAIVTTNGILINITAEEATGDVNLIVEAINANTNVTVFGTLIV
jgi:hypothetical protein